MKCRHIQDKNNIVEKVKELRSQTLLSIKECKEALLQSQGNTNKAKNILKKKGLLLAEKRMHRRTSNGAVFLLSENNKTAILELTCETQFVAINRIFLSTGDKLVKQVLLNQSSETTNKMDNIIKDSISIIKENMVLRNITFWKLKSNEVLGNYKHDDNKIVVIVRIICNNLSRYPNSLIKNLADDIAMHICACKPLFIESKDINIMDQCFVKDNNKSIKNLIEEIEKIEGDITISEFKYLKVSPFIHKYI